MKSILLTGGGFANKGAEALLKTVRDELCKRLVDTTFQAIIPASHAKDARNTGFIPCKSRSIGEFAGYHFGRTFRLKTVRRWTAASQSRRYLQWLRKCAVVLDISGYAYADRFGPYPMQLTERFVSGCREASVPYVFMPQAWGPLTGSFSQRAIRSVAEQAAVIYARDKVSLQYLRSIPDISSNILELAPDIVLKFKPHENSDTLGPLERADLLPKIGKRVGICPNIRIYISTKQEGMGIANPYVRWLAGLCKEFLAKTDVELVIFGHEMSPSWSRRDDLYVCRLIRQIIPDDGRIKYFLERCSADTMKLLIRNIDFLVGSRFHSIIAALSLHLPTVALGWSHKYQELLNDAGIGELAFSYEAMSDSATTDRILQAWVNRDQVRYRLEQSVPLMKRKVDQVFDRVAEISRRAECC